MITMLRVTTYCDAPSNFSKKFILLRQTTFLKKY